MMKRAWRVSEFHKCLLIKQNIITKPSIPVQFIRHLTQTPAINRNQTTFSDILFLLTEKGSPNPEETIEKRNLREKVSELKDQILTQDEDAEKIEKVLEENGTALFRIYPDGSAAVELLSQLKSNPYLAMEVFSWRRNQLDHSTPMTAEEYAYAIAMAGRLKDVALAIELFKEASNKQLIATSLFNSLMSAYMCNGLAMRCQSLFRDLKMESTCTPSIVTYNILISAFGRLMLVDHMEATLREVNDLNLPPTVNTYKGLIAGYITAWKWEEMEKTYRLMREGPVKPNIDIHLLMLRGYAHSGKLEKMEEIYEMVRDHVDHNEISLVRTMICAYCRSSDVARVEKVRELVRLIPENEYRPWLNVRLICLYAKEDLLEQMEDSIKEAFEHKAYVTTVGVMRCIVASYFRHNAVDNLAYFVQRAECAGWKICRSLYHCKMVMYSSEMRLFEMERVLYEMDRVNMQLSKKTFWILCNAYRKWGQRSKLEQVFGMMCKHGYEIPMDACNS